MSNEEWTLTTGACARMLDPDAAADKFAGYEPVVQFLSIKPLQGDRYRMILSDGVHFLQAMISTQLNDMAISNELRKHTVVKLDKFSVNNIQGKRFVIVLDLKVLGQPEHKIGEPVLYEGNDKPENSKPATANPSSSINKPATTSARPSGPSPATNLRNTPAKKTNICPIESLSPYQNNWTIKARVTQKSDVRTYSNQRGEGKLFNAILMDDTGEIKATGFNAVCDALYPKLEEGKVYYISKGRVNIAKKQFSTLQNEFEIMFEAMTEVNECTDATSIPEIKFNFVKLNELESVQKDAIIDVIGILHKTNSLDTIQSKTTGKTVPKLDVELVDNTEYSVRMTIWGSQAEKFNYTNHPVIAFRGAKVGEFQGKTLSMFSSTTMHVDPDIPDAHILRGWYDGGGSETQFRSQGSGSFVGMTSATLNRNEFKLIGEVRDSTEVGHGDKPDYFSVRATVISIKSENIVYPACPTANCNKKVIETDGLWRCEKCNMGHEKPEYRYLVSLCVADHTGQLWFQAFNDVGMELMGMTANDLQRLKDEEYSQGSNAFTETVNKASCQMWNFSVRAKMETYGESSRVKYGITKVFRPDFKEEARTLLDAIKQTK